jgi:hypothetical protein
LKKVLVAPLPYVLRRLPLLQDGYLGGPHLLWGGPQQGPKPFKGLVSQEKKMYYLPVKISFHLSRQTFYFVLASSMD